jgi:hypothetical protein
MTEIEIPLPWPLDEAQIAGAIEEAATGLGMEVRLKGSLAKYAGSIHWHFGRAGARGTLEVTLWPSRRRSWITVQAAMTGDWIPAASARLTEMVAQALEGTAAGCESGGVPEMISCGP